MAGRVENRRYAREEDDDDDDQFITIDVNQTCRKSTWLSLLIIILLLPPTKS